MQLDQYLLRVDLADLVRDIDAATNAYTDYGKTVKTMISEASDNFGDLQKKLAGVNAEIGRLDPEINKSIRSVGSSVSGATRGLGTLSQHSERIAQQLKELKASESSAGHPGMQDYNNVMGNAGKRAEELKLTADSADSSAQESQKRMGAAMKHMESKSNALTSAVNTEVKAAKGKMSSIVGGYDQGLLTSGSISGGLISAMIVGVTEPDRLKQWSGELLNVFEATGESIRGKTTRNATKFYADFQNRAANLMGISRESIQATLKAAVDAGYQVGDIHQQIGIKIDKVGKGGKSGDSLGAATIALDKHFNLETGTAMKNIVKISQDLGGAIDDNTRKYWKLGFAAQRSGMGISKYVDSVLAGASAMKQYGIELETVADTMQTIQDHYEGMGLSKQYAGARASQVVDGLANTLVNMPKELKAKLGEKMTGLSGWSARQYIEDGFKRAAAGQDDEFLQKFYQALYEEVGGGGRDRAQSIYLMEQLTGADNLTSATLVDLSGKIATSNSLKDLSTKEMKQGREAFTTEGKRISELAKLQFQLKQAISKIGQGLIKILVSLVGVLALLVKGIPAILANLNNPVGMYAVVTSMRTHMDALSSHAGAGIDQIVEGATEAGKHLQNQFQGDYAPVKSVLDSDFDKVGGVVTWEGIARGALDAAGKGAEEVQAIISQAAGKLGIGGGGGGGKPKAAPMPTPSQAVSQEAQQDQSELEGLPSQRGGGSGGGVSPWDGSSSSSSEGPPSQGAESTQDPGPVASTERIITIPGPAIATRKIEVDNASLDPAGTLA